jgi:hypothetical protein
VPWIGARSDADVSEAVLVDELPLPEEPQPAAIAASIANAPAVRTHLVRRPCSSRRRMSPQICRTHMNER